MIDLTDRIAKLSPEKRELLRQKLKNKSSKKLQTRQVIAPQKRDLGPIPLSLAQQRLWFLDQLEPAKATYNIPGGVRLQGPLNITTLEQSLSAIFDRHEILRTTFPTISGQPGQQISPTKPYTLPVIDLQKMSADKQTLEIRRLADREAEQTFDLTKGPLLRMILLKLGEMDHVLFLTMHHIISDGWSIGVFFKELSALYALYAGEKSIALPALPIQYADFAIWQRQWLQGDILERQLGYWRKRLEGAPAISALPTDHPRPAVQTYAGKHLPFTLAKPLSAALKTLSQESGATLFMTLLAAFKTLMYRYSGQDDLLIGTPIANRNRIEIENLIGFFINSLVLRTNLAGNPTFSELLARVREVALEAYAHQDLPFEKLVEELQPVRDLSHTPLFQTWFVLQNTPESVLELPDLTISPLEIEPNGVKFELAMTLVDSDQGLTGTISYNSDLFEPATIERLIGHFQTLLAGIVADPRQHLSDLPLLTDAERRQQTRQRQQARPIVPFVEFKRADVTQSIPERFARQVEQYPDNIAIKTKTETWTYQTLNGLANQIAHTILDKAGQQAGRVALLFEQGGAMIAGMLGILKAGKTYVSLDPAYPQERLAYILKDAQADTILTNNLNRDFAKRLAMEGQQLINIDHLIEAGSVEPTAPAKSPSANTMAYILYTSGSTGEPKGVMQSHGNVLRHIRNYTNNLHIGSEDRLTLLSSYGFDAAVMDIYGALLNGATLYPMNVKSEPFSGLAQWLTEQSITIYHSTPTVYRYFMNAVAEEKALSQQAFLTIRLVVLGGEEVNRQDVELYKRYFSSDCIFINGLGPTESTVSLQYFINHDTELKRETVPVGYPVEDTDIILLDKAGKETGVYGEIAIKSPQVALGYWQKPAQTTAAFLPDPDDATQRLYRTGDMGRLRPDGTFEFVGRRDSQVKIRGFRIELREIETVLRQHPAVQEAIVAAQDAPHLPGEKHLVAYVVAMQQQRLIIDELSKFLKTKLPDYMVPAAFFPLDALPLTPTGKINRQALPRPDTFQMNGIDFASPKDIVELQLTKIWERVLGVHPVGVRDNFFDLGGHSLLGVRLFSQIEKGFGKSLPLATLFQAPTVEQLANILREMEPPTPPSSLVAFQQTGSRPPLFCLPGNLGNVFTDLKDLARHLDSDQPFYALQDGADNPTQIEMLAGHYLKEIKAVQPEGPYYLAGICSGGVIAFEMAQQLHAQGEETALLALIEPSPPTISGPRAYFNFITILLGRVATRFSYHAQNISQVDKTERESYARLKTKLIANMWSGARYKARKYPGWLKLFLTKESLENNGPYRRLNWRKLSTAGTDVFEIPGTHNSITGNSNTEIDETHMQALAIHLNACLDEAQSVGGEK